MNPEPSIRQASEIQAEIQHRESLAAATEMGKRRQEWMETEEGKSGQKFPLALVSDLGEKEWIEFNERSIPVLIRCAKMVTSYTIDGEPQEWLPHAWTDAADIPLVLKRLLERLFVYILNGQGDPPPEKEPTPETA